MGCTRNFSDRRDIARNLHNKDYLEEYEILEILENVTAIEAGNREWYWAIKLGYKRYQHYSVSVKNLKMASKSGAEVTNNICRKNKTHFFSSEYQDKLLKIRIKAGSAQKAVEACRRNKTGFFGPKRHNFSRDQAIKINNSQKIKGTGPFKRVECPHCGKESNLPIMTRWHFDNCKALGEIKTMVKNIFKKEYGAEELCDVERDIGEAFDPRFNEVIKEIPENEDGFPEGVFVVTIEWRPNG